MLKRSGVEVIINADIVSNVILLSGALIGLICGILAGLSFFFISLSYSSNNIDITVYTALSVVLGFFIGFTIAIVLLEVIESGVATTLVLLAEEPHSIKNTKPLMFAEFERTYGAHLRM
jgi:hypothetical protein